MSKKTKQLISRTAWATSALALALAAGFAQANPVTQWSYSTNSTFSNPTWSGPAGTGGTQTLTPSGDELSWGRSTGNFQIPTNDAAENRSALTIGNAVTGTKTGGGPATGTINTAIGSAPNVALGQIKNGISITHWNNPINSTFGTLTAAKITDTLTLTPLAPAEYAGEPFVNAPTLVFDFQFRETPNNGNNQGNCADGSSAASFPQGCPDLFGFVGDLTLNNPFQYLDSGVDGILGNGDDFMRTYFASLFVLDDNDDPFPLATLNAGECGALGLGAGCFGFRTLEAAATTAKFAFAVTTERLVINVPEPGTLALLGLALAGLGITSRRRSALSKR